MPRRLLNIASIVCLVLCVALMGMWVRSYRSQNVVHTRFCNACREGQKPIVFFIFSSLGRLWLTVTDEENEAGLLSANDAVEHLGFRPKGRLAALGFSAYFSWAHEFLMLPFWFLVLASGLLAMLLRMSWPPRFTLHSLFIATTFLAIVLGMIAWLDRVWIGK
jgi:hypothetical protein